MDPENENLDIDLSDVTPEEWADFDVAQSCALDSVGAELGLWKREVEMTEAQAELEDAIRLWPWWQRPIVRLAAWMVAGFDPPNQSSSIDEHEYRDDGVKVSRPVFEARGGERWFLWKFYENGRWVKRGLWVGRKGDHEAAVQRIERRLGV